MNERITSEWARLRAVWGSGPLFLLIGTMVLMPLVPSAAVLCAYAGFFWLAAKNKFGWFLPTLWRTPYPYLMVFGLLHIIGLAWTSNLGFGLFDLQIKLPLLVLPLLAGFCGAHVRTGRDLLAFVFSLSGALMVLVCTVASVWRIATGSDLSPAQEVFSSYWSLLLHPSYFALYLSLAIAAWCLLPIHTWVPRSWSVGVLALLNLGVVLSASKIGWLLLTPLLVTLVVLVRRNAFVRRTLLGMMAFAAAGVAVLVMASPYARDRVQEMFRASSEQKHDPNATTSSAVRWLTWGTAWELFKVQPWSGTGTGDIKDELVAVYNAKGYTGAAERRLNAHNQYLQSAACLGVLALAALLAMVLVPLAAGRARDPLFTLFVLLVALNWLVESMLEVQAGAVFFAVFAVLLLWKDEAPHLRAS
ncbi:MAG: O-antigen ligase family protein [Flavobacteriales bacterium]|nr:MAG: O-antigen ligase family protein [Flavobacteriales bacterium]